MTNKSHTVLDAAKAVREKGLDAKIKSGHQFLQHKVQPPGNLCFPAIEPIDFGNKILEKVLSKHVWQIGDGFARTNHSERSRSWSLRVAVKFARVVYFIAGYSTTLYGT